MKCVSDSFCNHDCGICCKGSCSTKTLHYLLLGLQVGVTVELILVTGKDVRPFDNSQWKIMCFGNVEMLNTKTKFPVNIDSIFVSYQRSGISVIVRTVWILKHVVRSHFTTQTPIGLKFDCAKKQHTKNQSKNMILKKINLKHHIYMQYNVINIIIFVS